MNNKIRFTNVWLLWNCKLWAILGVTQSKEWQLVIGMKGQIHVNVFFDEEVSLCDLKLLSLFHKRQIW